MWGVAHWIEQRAMMTPNRLALVGERKRFTYQEMAKTVHRLAHYLHEEMLVKKGERIAILSENREEVFLLYFALAKLGAIAVPLNVRLTVGELYYQLIDSGTRLLWVSERFQEMGDLLGKSGYKGLLAWIDGRGGMPSLLQRISSYPDQFTPPEEGEGSDPLFIMYTSGTTGRPKGAILTQENQFWNGVNNIFGLEIQSSDRILTLLPLFHVGGIGLFAFPGFLAGSSIFVPTRFDPEDTLAWIEREKITIVMGVPTMLDALRKSPSFGTRNLSSVRWFYSGGAPCPIELLDDYLSRGLPLGQGFGMTESSPTIFLLMKDDYKRKKGSIGKPVLFSQVRVVDEAGVDVPRGEVGELWIKGPHLFKGYWNKPEETAKAIAADWFRTGDMVRMDEEGFVYVAGRKKEMFISGGENVYPIEVEQVLYSHPLVDEAAVVGIPHEKWGEVGVAWVVVKEGGHVTEEELSQYMARHLAKYKCPKKYVFVKSLPKNATGKIDKNSIQNESLKRLSSS